ncbi:MAG TPA: response regulator, partial [Candidatus Sulfotelmatobacter sp.]|nr:response regulator [Candidatus Sulfotelmatobacter sp.]
MAADKLLVIDDQIAIAELVANVARTCGYETEITTNPDVFLRRVEVWKPSHLMLDLNMPVVDGVELLRHLAARKTQAQITIMSGLDGKVVEAARRLGTERGLDM